MISGEAEHDAGYRNGARTGARADGISVNYDYSLFAINCLSRFPLTNKQDLVPKMPQRKEASSVGQVGACGQTAQRNVTQPPANSDIESITSQPALISRRPSLAPLVGFLLDPDSFKAA